MATQRALVWVKWHELNHGRGPVFAWACMRSERESDISKQWVWWQAPSAFAGTRGPQSLGLMQADFAVLMERGMAAV